MDENRYKDFRKNHLNRIIANFDSSLKKREVEFYVKYKKLKDYLEAKLENCEITHNRWLFPQPYWWIWSKNNQGSNHFVTPRTCIDYLKFKSALIFIASPFLYL